MEVEARTALSYSGNILPCIASTFQTLLKRGFARENRVSSKRNLMRLMVYSHDTFGLGNIRRMLAICKHLHASIPDLSILIVSGSPMLQRFRIEPAIDSITFPCLKRPGFGELVVLFL